MTRGQDNFNPSKNYVRAKLENFGKGIETPYFSITKWNGHENEELSKADFIEGQLKHIETKDTNYGKYAILTLEDAEGNSIEWGMKLGKTMRNVLFKLYAPAMKDIRIKNVRLKCGTFETQEGDRKFVSLFIDGQKRDNPFTTLVDGKYVVSDDVKSKVREIKDPETGEVVKRDETKLDEWIESLIIPTINADLGEKSIAEELKSKNDMTDYSDLPF